MNLVFVNHMHPATQHVSGMRSWFFARELAKRGHRVVQLCEWREGAQPAPPPDRLAQQLQTHDWTEPLLLAIRPQRRALLERIRSPRTPAVLRKALVTWSYLRHSGMFTDFSQATWAHLEVLAREFRPQVTWGLFGNTDCWLIAQRLGRLAACPWVADVKDSWEVFLQRPLRAPMARRFRGMASCTANSEFNARVIERWFPPKPVVVYSGVDPCFQEASPVSREPGCFRLTLTGSVYDIEVLQRFVGGLKDWLAGGPVSALGRSNRLEVIYAGASAAAVAPVLRPLDGLARVQVNSYLPLPALAALCRSASVNAYLWNPKTFHHKLLELLSCGRPVLAFPGETDESRRLAAASGGELFCCADSADLASALNQVSGQSPVPRPVDAGCDAFAWAAQSLRLESLFNLLGRA